MSWCDKLASTPGVGFSLDWQFLSGSDILDALSPLFRPYVHSGQNSFSIDRLDADAAGFSTDDGYQIVIETQRVFANFQHRLRARPTSGGPPVMEMLSHPMPYTSLLPSVMERLSEAIVKLPHSKGRNIQRVGIVSTTVVSEDELPPGISRFIDYVARPWGKSLAEYSFNITTELGESAHGADKCIHAISKKANQVGNENLVTVSLDWQRWFSAGHPVNAANLKSLFGHAEKAALNYFEEIAEGSMFDEDVIRGSDTVVRSDPQTRTSAPQPEQR